MISVPSGPRRSMYLAFSSYRSLTSAAKRAAPQSHASARGLALKCHAKDASRRGNLRRSPPLLAFPAAAPVRAHHVLGWDMYIYIAPGTAASLARLSLPTSRARSTLPSRPRPRRLTGLCGRARLGAGRRGGGAPTFEGRGGSRVLFSRPRSLKGARTPVTLLLQSEARCC